MLPQWHPPPGSTHLRAESASCWNFIHDRRAGRVIRVRRLRRLSGETFRHDDCCEITENPQDLASEAETLRYENLLLSPASRHVANSRLPSVSPAQRLQVDYRVC